MSTTSSGSPASAEHLVVRTARDVIEAVNSGRVSGGHSRAIIFIALGGIFIDAYDFTSLAFGLPDIATEFALSPAAAGVVGASIMVGALIGAFLGGYLVDRLGRYKMFMADMLFFVVAAVGCALAPNVETLTVFRFLMGFGIGLDFPVALAFIAEYTALKGRGGRVTLWQPMWYAATGTSFAVLLPLYFLVPEANHDMLWRWAVGFGAVPALVVMAVRRKYMDESAAWAAKRGNLPQAVEILRRRFDADVVLADDWEAEREPETKPSLSGFVTLFSQKYRRRTILAGVVGASQSMQYYAVGFFLPVIVASFFSTDRLTLIIVPLLFNLLFGVTGGFAGVGLSERLGSWKLATSGFAVCLVALVLLATLGQPEGTTAVVAAAALLGLFVFFHAYGPGAQGMTLATTSYPTSLRGTGSGFGQATLRIGSTISLLLFPTLNEALGSDVFFVVALAPALGLLTCLLIRWDPADHDVDAEDFQTRASPARPSFGTTPSPGTTA